MARNPKSSILNEIRKASVDEKSAIEFMERRRWPHGAACPRCGSDDVYAMKGRDGERHKHFRWRCRSCKKMFSVRTGTVMEESRLPVSVWCHAFWRACASKKGVSALQISRECEISYKSALFLMHRIREAMREDPEGRPLMSGTIEADETYVGGKPRYRAGTTAAGKRATGRGTKKVPVFAMVERGGRAHARVIERVSARTLLPAIWENVTEDSRIITDELGAYTGVGRYVKGGQDTIRHSSGEYVRGDVTTNTVESFFALIKRGVYGTFHSVSKHHLPRYLDEFTFRYNTRKLSDAERVDRAILASEGKRLTYQQPC